MICIFWICMEEAFEERRVCHQSPMACSWTSWSHPSKGQQILAEVYIHHVLQPFHILYEQVHRSGHGKGFVLDRGRAFLLILCCINVFCMRRTSLSYYYFGCKSSLVIELLICKKRNYGVCSFTTYYGKAFQGVGRSYNCHPL